MTISFLAAGPEHLAELLGLMKELQEDDSWSVPFDETATSGVVAHLLANPSFGRVWLICADGETVGYVVMSFDYSLEYRGRNAWIDELFVRRSHRGRGIATQAIEFFTRQAKELGITCIHLEVNHGNRAIELYRRLGFEDHRRYLMTKWIIEKP